MNATQKQTVIAMAAVLAALAGLVLSVQAIRATPEAIRHMEQKRADLLQLQTMKEQSAANLAAVGMFTSLTTKRAAPLTDLLRDNLTARKTEIHPRDVRPLIEGWSQKRVDVILDDVPLVDVGRFLAVAENQRPPWRLGECTITPSDTLPGAARVTLVLETLEAAMP